MTASRDSECGIATLSHLSNHTQYPPSLDGDYYYGDKNSGDNDDEVDNTLSDNNYCVIYCNDQCQYQYQYQCQYQYQYQNQ